MSRTYQECVAVAVVMLALASPALAFSNCMAAMPAGTADKADCAMAPSGTHHGHSATPSIEAAQGPCCTMSAPAPASPSDQAVGSKRLAATGAVRSAVVVAVAPVSSSDVAEQTSPPAVPASQARLCTFLI